MVNYDFRRTVVFLSRERHSLILPRYLALAAVSGLISYSLINLQVSHLHMPVKGAKLLAESLLFLGNFADSKRLCVYQMMRVGFGPHTTLDRDVRHADRRESGFHRGPVP